MEDFLGILSVIFTIVFICLLQYRVSIKDRIDRINRGESFQKEFRIPTPFSFYDTYFSHPVYKQSDPEQQKLYRKFIKVGSIMKWIFITILLINFYRSYLITFNKM